MRRSELPPVVWPDTADDLRTEVRTFLAAELAAGSFEPDVDSWLGGFNPDFSRKLAAQGWIGMTWPRRYGGHERSDLERFIVIEELLAAGAPVAAHWIADRQTGPTLLRYGTEDQRARYLPGIAQGERYFAIGMSEPDSGSDLASVRTRATPDGEGGWRVTGSKVWTSGAHRCHHMLALVRTDHEVEDRHDGLSQLIIDLDGPGITVRPIHLLTGEHHFNEVVLDDAPVPAENLLGERGDGWRQVTSELGYERSGPERFLSTVPLLRAFIQVAGDEPAARNTIGELAAELWSIRQMSTRVAAALGEGDAPDVEAALVKDVGTRFEQASIEAVRRATPRWQDEVALERLVHRATMQSPGFTLRGGTNEILRLIVARGLGL